jgi:hypothetical protein
MMRQINFILWGWAVAATWSGAPTRLPVGHEWIPIVGLIVSLFWPSSSKGAISKHSGAQVDQLASRTSSSVSNP